MLHGTTLNQVANIFGLFNRAARQVVLDIDPAETARIAQLSVPVYDQVFDYAPPVDLKGNKIIDLVVQGQSTPRPRFSQAYNQNFDISKSYSLLNMMTMQYNTGVQTLRIAYVNPSRTIDINTAAAISGNGTWAATGTASNLEINDQFNVNGLPLMQFDLATGTGLLTNSTMAAVDLSAHEDQSGIFFTINVPTASNLTSVGVRWGSSASDYWEVTGITTNFQGNSFANGLNLIRALWSSATTTGSPDASAVDYVRVAYVASGSIPATGFSDISSKLGYITNISYYSRYLFANSGGTWQETCTAVTDTINLNTDSYNIFLYQAAFLAVQQALGQDAGYDTNVFLKKYDDAVLRYKRMYKSQITQAQTPYYQSTFNGYSQWLGSNYQSW